LKFQLIYLCKCVGQDVYELFENSWIMDKGQFTFEGKLSKKKKSTNKKIKALVNVNMF